MHIINMVLVILMFVVVVSLAQGIGQEDSIPVVVNGSCERDTSTFIFPSLDQLIRELSSSSECDSVRPSRVTDFNATATGRNTLSLNWTAPHEHVDTSTVNGYEIRMSQNESQLTQTDFVVGDEGMMVLSLPDSRQRSELYVQPGTKIFVDVWLGQDLVPESTYFLALRAVDASGNWSPVSNHAKVRVESMGLLGWILSCLLWIIELILSIIDLLLWIFIVILLIIVLILILLYILASCLWRIFRYLFGESNRQEETTHEEHQQQTESLCESLDTTSSKSARNTPTLRSDGKSEGTSTSGFQERKQTQLNISRCESLDTTSSKSARNTPTLRSDGKSEGTSTSGFQERKQTQLNISSGGESNRQEEITGREHQQQMESLKRETQESIRSIKKFISLFDAHQQEVHNNLDKLKSLAKRLIDLETWATDRRIATSSMNAVGSTCAITGMVLAPFTAGLSTVLTFGSVGLGLAGSVTDVKMDSNKGKEENQIFEEADKIKGNASDKIKEISAALKDASKDVEQLISSAASLKRFTFTANVDIGFGHFRSSFLNTNIAMIHTVPEIIKTMKIFPIKTTNKLFSVGKTVIPVGKGLKIASGSLAGIFLVLDVKDVVVNSIKRKNGCKSEAAEQIETDVDHLKSVMRNLHSQYVKYEKILNALVI